jgi:hypothetical protein
LLVPCPALFDVEIANIEPKKCKPPGIDEIPAGGNTLHSEILKFSKSVGIRKNSCSHSSERSLMLCPFVKSVIKLIVVTTEEYQYYHVHTKCYPIFHSEC